MNSIVIACDHAGYEYKNHIMKYLEKQGYNLIDKGTDSSESVDYPDFVHPAAKLVSDKKDMLGIFICGSGNGVAMTANKHQGIRAAVCWNVNLAMLAREHNNANVIAIPARFISKRMSVLMVKAFLESPFEGGRHLRRINKISSC